MLTLHTKDQNGFRAPTTNQKVKLVKQQIINKGNSQQCDYQTIELINEKLMSNIRECRYYLWL